MLFIYCMVGSALRLPVSPWFCPSQGSSMQSQSNLILQDQHGLRGFNRNKIRYYEFEVTQIVRNTVLVFDQLQARQIRFVRQRTVDWGHLKLLQQQQSERSRNRGITQRKPNIKSVALRLSSPSSNIGSTRSTEIPLREADHPFVWLCHFKTPIHNGHQ